jgi:hypothetical protein
MRNGVVIALALLYGAGLSLLILRGPVALAAGLGIACTILCVAPFLVIQEPREEEPMPRKFVLAPPPKSTPMRILARKGYAETLRAKITERQKIKPAAQRFDIPVTVVGTGSWRGQDGGGVTVCYDTTLGAGGKACAVNILSRIDALMLYCDSAFGVVGKSGNVIVDNLGGNSDGTGGAYHAACAFNSDGGGSDWYMDYAAQSNDMVLGLTMAEVCESYMGLQGRGWPCGGSSGEGLSRVLAEIASGGPNGPLLPFASGSSWDGTDWISKDQGTDGDYPSIGASVLCIWWLLALGYTIQQIAQAGETDGTLSSCFAVLTGRAPSEAFTDFNAAVRAIGFPAASDNPWNTPTPPYPGVPIPQPPQPQPPQPQPPTTYPTITINGGTLAAGTYSLVPTAALAAMQAELATASARIAAYKQIADGWAMLQAASAGARKDVGTR